MTVVGLTEALSRLMLMTECCMSRVVSTGLVLVERKGNQHEAAPTGGHKTATLTGGRPRDPPPYHRKADRIFRLGFLSVSPSTSRSAEVWNNICNRT